VSDILIRSGGRLISSLSKELLSLLKSNSNAKNVRGIKKEGFSITIKIIL
jgi:hypothetical protein